MYGKKFGALLIAVLMTAVVAVPAYADAGLVTKEATVDTGSSDGVTIFGFGGSYYNYTSSEFNAFTGISVENGDVVTLKYHNGTAWTTTTFTGWKNTSTGDVYLNVTTPTDYSWNNKTDGTAGNPVYLQAPGSDSWDEAYPVNFSKLSSTKSMYVIALPGTTPVQIGDYWYKWTIGDADTGNVSVILSAKDKDKLTGKDATVQLANFSYWSSNGVWTLNMSLEGQTHRMIVSAKELMSSSTTASVDYVPIASRGMFETEWFKTKSKTEISYTETTDYQMYTTDTYLEFTVKEDSGTLPLAWFMGAEQTFTLNATNGLKKVEDPGMLSAETTTTQEGTELTVCGATFTVIEKITKDTVADIEYTGIISDVPEKQSCSGMDYLRYGLNKQPGLEMRLS